MEENKEQPVLDQAEEEPGRSLWGDALYRLRRDKLSVFSFTIIVLYLIVAISAGLGLIATKYDDPFYKADEWEAAGLLKSMSGTIEDGSPADAAIGECLAALDKDGKEAMIRLLPAAVREIAGTGHANLADKLKEIGRRMESTDSYAPPSWKHILGTDIQGRDVFQRVVQGTWISLQVALIMSVIYIVIAVFLGSLAGYFGGWVDDIIQWVYQTLASVPGLLLLISLTFVLGQGLMNVAIALGVVGWVGLCRLMRAEYLKHKERDYVLAAKALGAGHFRIIFRHILPNTFHLVIISFSLGFVSAIMSEVVLTFIGLGAKADEPSWGRMISEARAELARDPAVWWPLAGATAAMFVVCLAFNIFGDSLRDALDPKLKV